MWVYQNLGIKGLMSPFLKTHWVSLNPSVLSFQDKLLPVFSNWQQFLMTRCSCQFFFHDKMFWSSRHLANFFHNKTSINLIPLECWEHLSSNNKRKNIHKTHHINTINCTQLKGLVLSIQDDIHHCTHFWWEHIVCGHEASPLLQPLLECLVRSCYTRFNHVTSHQLFRREKEGREEEYVIKCIIMKIKVLFLSVGKKLVIPWTINW